MDNEVNAYISGKTAYNFLKLAMSAVISEYKDKEFKNGNKNPEQYKEFLRQNPQTSLSLSDSLSIMVLNDSYETQNYINVLKESAAKNNFNISFFKDTSKDPIKVTLVAFPRYAAEKILESLKEFEKPKTEQKLFSEEDVRKDGRTDSSIVWVPMRDNVSEINMYIDEACRQGIPVVLSMDGDTCSIGYNSSSENKFNKVIRNVSIDKVLRSNSLNIISDELAGEIYKKAQTLGNEERFNVVLGNSGGVLDVSKNAVEFRLADGNEGTYRDFTKKENAYAFFNLMRNELPCIITGPVPDNTEERKSLVYTELKNKGILKEMPLDERELYALKYTMRALDDAGEKIDSNSIKNLELFIKSGAAGDLSSVNNAAICQNIPSDVIDKAVNEINRNINSVKIAIQKGIYNEPERVQDIERGETVR